MYSKILLPTNGSAVAERANPHAFDLARKYSAELHIVSVAKGGGTSERSIPPVEVTESEKPLTTSARETVESVAEEAEEHRLESTTAVIEGSASDELTDYIEENDIDHVVMGGRKRSPTGKMLFGSVTQSLILHSDVPVTVI
jgi:nucleotide-binding universal stress UspA family protein